MWVADMFELVLLMVNGELQGCSRGIPMSTLYGHTKALMVKSLFRL